MATTPPSISRGYLEDQAIAKEAAKPRPKKRAAAKKASK